jgi:hypothetical protein
LEDLGDMRAHYIKKITTFRDSGIKGDFVVNRDTMHDSVDAIVVAKVVIEGDVVGTCERCVGKKRRDG